MTDYKQKWRLGLIRGSDIGHRSDQQVPLCHGWNAFAAVVCISAITVFEFSHQRPATAREEKKKPKTITTPKTSHPLLPQQYSVTAK